MSEMVERVAAAIKSQRIPEYERKGFVLDDVDRRCAVAAIEAMREPTHAMIQATKAEDGDDPWWLEEWLEGAWPKMIDEALK